MDDSKACAELSSLTKLLAPLEKTIADLSRSLNEIRTFYNERFTSQQRTINKLVTSVKLLEDRLAYSVHITALHDRKIDDLEQVSRKVNLRISGIEVTPNDSPELIIQKISGEVINHTNLNIADFDRCHRVGRKFNKNGVTYQDVLIKLCSWRARDIVYRNRKSFSFFVKPDLTSRRQEILKAARDELEESTGEQEGDDDGAIARVVDYIFVDENCKLKVKSMTGKYFMFNSMEEFFCIVTRLDFEDIVTKEHKNDEAKDELYH